MNNEKRAKGSLEIICGSMFSGKTEELMRHLKRAEYAKRNVLTVKHHIDNRCSYTTISTHNGSLRKAHPFKNSKEDLQRIIDLADESIDIVGIDEVQFFAPDIVGVICALVDAGKRVIAAGLDLTFQGEPFGVMPVLLSIADNVTKLRAICVQCGREATFTQRIIDGKPARYNDPIVLVGAKECYEARCRNCFSIDKAPHPEKILTPQSSALHG